MAKTFRGPVPHHIREELLKKAGYACTTCGATEPLNVCFLVPPSEGGSTDPSNLTVLCANCHYLMDTQPPESHFIKYLSSLIDQSPKFESVAVEPLIKPELKYRADIIA